MAYSYHDYITTKHDAEFAKIHDLKWDPAVGKNYHKTRIMIMGTHTAWEDRDDERDTTRHIVFHDEAEDRPFKFTVKMFLEEADIEYNEQNRNIFWSSVAFNNFIQGSVSDKHPPDDEVAGMVTASARAYSNTTRVIEPDLVIFWSNNLDYKYEQIGGHLKEYPPISGFTPRVALEKPTIVGIYHPSMAFPRTEWMAFLKTCEYTKSSIEHFLSYLKKVTV